MRLHSLFLKSLVVLFLALPAGLAAQQKQLTGLWTGNLHNNDSVVRKDLSFEIALTQYKDKVYGYSRRTFLVNDTLYYVVKRVKGKVENGICEVKDDEYLAHNFAKVDKGVKIIYTFRLNEKDSTWVLDGDWTTNQVKKKYYAVDGSVQLKEDKHYTSSKLFDHLEELGLAKDVAFYQEAVGKRQTSGLAAVPVQKQTPPAKVSKEPVAKKEEKKSNTIAVTVAKAEPVVPAAQLSVRRMAAPQEILFEADSLQIAIYDNGEIDGDTVSVLLDGELIISREGLKASAIKKTIYLPSGSDSAVLTLYAENLGRYPPNTGLLVVYDGETRHQVRFSADLNQNASIIFRRKRK